MSIVNEAEYTWSRHAVTVPVGTTVFDLPVKIYAVKGEGAVWLDSEAATAISEFPVAVDEITVTGAEMKLIGEQGKGSPVSSIYLDTAEGMTELEWASRTDDITIDLPFGFLWNGAEHTQLTFKVCGILSFDEMSTYSIVIHNRYSYASLWQTYGLPSNGVYSQAGTSGDRQFLKLRFDGYSYYSYTTDAYRSIWELFLFSDGTVFLNSIQAPSTCYNRFYLNSASQSFTVNNGGSAQVLMESADSGVTWTFTTLDGAARTTLYLVRKDGTLHTVTEGALDAIEAAELTAAVFLEHGFEALSTFVPEGEYGVLCWSTGQAPTVTATVTGSPPPQELTCTVDMSHPSISGIQQLTAEYSGSVELSHKTDGDWIGPMALSDWVAQDFAALYASLGEDKLLHLKFRLYGGAEFTNFKITFIN